MTTTTDIIDGLVTPLNFDDMTEESESALATPSTAPPAVLIPLTPFVLSSYHPTSNSPESFPVSSPTSVSGI